MRIGVVSDTHGSIKNIQKVYNLLAEDYKIDIFSHLGDNYDDLDSLKTIPDIRIIKVPGIYSSYYQDSTVPNRIVEKIEECRILFTHSPTSTENDPPGETNPEILAKDANVDLILFGHTHIPTIKKIDNKLWVNPGHLNINDKRGYVSSFAFLEINNRQIDIFINEFKRGNEICCRKNILTHHG